MAETLVMGAIVISVMGECCSLVPTRRRVGYFVNYTKNVEILKGEVEKLLAMRDDVLQSVNAALRNGDVITLEVTAWLKWVDRVIAESHEVIESHGSSNRRTHFRSSYRRSEEAEKIAMSIIELQSDGLFDSISYPAPPATIGSTFAGAYKVTESRRKVMTEVMEALKDDKVNIIGICGMGGIGKTVLVKEVAKQAKENEIFDEVVMAVVSQTPHFRRIQGQIADMLGIKFEEESDSGRAARLFEQLRHHKRVLVILDDVWESIDLEEVGIPLMNNGNGCKVVITSRNEAVCPRNEAFFLSVLPVEEAWYLFREIVGDSVDSRDLLPVAKKIVSECGGLPLAIVTIAGALRNKSSFIWKDALQQLRRSATRNISEMHGLVYSSLELSFNFLESEEEKSIFLLCCLFPEDADISIDCLMRYGTGLGLFEDVDTLEETRGRVEVLVSKLKASSLLQDGERHGCVRMHDVVRDFALSIASRDRQFFIRTGDELNEWPEHKSITAISLTFKVINELPNKLEYPKLNMLVLECNHSSPRIPTDFFEGMRELKVLHLSGMHLLSLSSSLQFLLNLRALFLNKCWLSDLSILGMLRQLEILCFSGSDIEELPREVGQLNWLKLLDLTRCDQLRRIVPQVISSLSKLEVLYMKNSCVRWEICEEGRERRNASIVELMSLTRLTTLEIHFPDAEFLPKSMHFEKLRRFAISIGSRFEEWENYESSRTLKLGWGTPLSDGVIVLLGRAEAIYLNGLKGLKYDNDNLHKKNFSDWEFLKVENCDGIEDIINIREQDLQNVSFSSSIVALDGGQIRAVPFGKLSTVKVTNCRLKYLFSPSSARCLAQLKELEIQECEIMEEIVAEEKGDNEAVDTIEFPQLRILRLDCLPNLTSFRPKMLVSEGDVNKPIQPLFNETVAMPVLEVLHLYRLDNMKEIWTDPRGILGFQNLSRLAVYECDSLESLFSPSMAKGLSQLQVLKVGECKKMEDILAKEKSIEAASTDKIEFPQVKTLTLVKLPIIRSFCFWNCTFEWPSLERVRVEGCPQMHTFSLGLLHTPKLQAVQIGERQWLWKGNLNSTIEYLEGELLYPTNEEFLISGDNLKEILDTRLHIKSFGQLKSLVAECCDEQLNVFLSSLLPRSLQLEKLVVEKCNSLEKVFNLEGLVVEEGKAQFFTHLRELRLCDLPQLTCIWNKDPSGVFSLRNLREVNVFSCGSLRNIFSSSVSKGLEKLRILKVHTCDMMEEIIARETEEEEAAMEKIVFHQLEHIELIGLSSFMKFHLGSYTFEWPRLQILRIERCPEMEAFTPGFLGMEELMTGTRIQVEFLRLWDLPKLMCIWNKDRSGLFYLQNLRDVNVLRCGRLRNLFSSSVSKGLEQLRILKVHTCEMMEEIIAVETEEEEAAKEKIVFHQLEHIELIGLSSFMKFHLGSYTFEWPRLQILRIEQCPEMKAFTPGFLSMEELMTDDGRLEDTLEGEMIAFPGMQELHLVCLDNFEKIWRGKIPARSFSELRVLEVDTCGKLLNVIPSDLLPRLGSLEKLTVQRCKSLKEVFNLHGPVIEKIHAEPLLLSKLRKLVLINLPNLKHLFSGDFAGTHVLENLQVLKVKNCGSLRNLFSPSVARCLMRLNEVEITDCDVMEEIVVEERGGEMIDLILFPELKFVVLENLPCLISFGPGSNISKFPSFEKLRIKNCPGLKTLFSGFYEGTRQHLFAQKVPIDRLKELYLIHMGDFQEVFDLEGHGIANVHEKLLPQLRYLVLTDLPNVLHMWKKDPAGISDFRKLRSLQVIKCHGLRYLFSASTARNLEQLQLLKIFGCQAMEEVITNGKAMEKMTFPKLKCLILKSLPNLMTFCQGSCPYEWPSLEIVRVNGVPKMKIFAPGSQSTPRLKAIYVTFLEICWNGDLNSTIQHIYEKNGGQHGRTDQKILFSSLQCHILVESSSKVNKHPLRKGKLRVLSNMI